MTPKERRLLMYSVRNAGQIVTHKELLEAMSSGTLSKSVRDLRQYILHLRKKIEIDPALPRVIITHHRQGYSLAGKEDTRRFPELEGT